ncbi:MAG: fibronectin type III domain-containing protein, partial [Bacteroidales bacterium]|nr:fibronectin type III domain-containing protein [Bacteroidales bacterium]
FSWPSTSDAGLYRIVSTTKVRSDSSPWDKITVKGLRLERGNKIAFGRVKGGDNSKARVLLDDISVEVKALSTSSLFAYPSSGITSSTIPFTWNGDPSHAFTATLYSDAACTQTVASFSIPASDACWNGNQPNYVFGGLTPNTTYYFKVEDTTDSVVSNVATATTESFTIVQMPASITSTGVALAEDFGELRWHSDMVAGAAGFVPSDLSSFSSVSVNKFIKGTSATDEKEFAEGATALPSSRLSGWAVDSKVFYHCGYLKMGESSKKGWILTPQFTVPGGKKAIVKVTVTAAKFNSSQEDNWAIAVLNETEANVSGYTASFDWPMSGSSDKYQTVGLGTSWTTVTAEGLAVLPGDRIAFGARSGASSSKSRVFISDIKVEVTGIVDDPVRVTVLETSSSTVAVEWTEGTSAADDKTKSYNASLYDNPECTGTPVRSFDFAANASYWNSNHSPRFVFTGLAANTMYYVKVTDGSNRASEAVAAKTKTFTVKTMPSSITETGLAFAEDFSECCWNSDYVNSAVGIDPASGTTLTTQTPLDSGEPYDDANRTAIYWQLFKQNARPSSRLADWLYDAEGSDRSGKDFTSVHSNTPTDAKTGRPVMVGPGYLQLGGRREVSSGTYDCAKAWIITPAFPIPSGKVATVNVKITAATPGSQTNKWVIATTNSGNDYGSGWLSFSWKDRSNTSYYQKVTLSSTFKEYTKTLLLEEGDRILVGPSQDFSNPTGFWKNNTDAAKTLDPIMFLSDITVTVTAIEDNGELVNVNAGIE